MKCSLDSSWRFLFFFPLWFSSISLHWSLRKPFLSLLAILWNSANSYIFPFILCFSLLFLSQLFVRPPQTAILLFAFLFLGDGLDPCLLYNVINLCPQFFRHCTGGSDQDHPQEKEMQKAKWLSEEAFQIAMKRREAKGKGEKERYTHLNAEFPK